MIQTPNLLRSLIPAVRARVKAASGLAESSETDAGRIRPQKGRDRPLERRLLVKGAPPTVPPVPRRTEKPKRLTEARSARCPNCGLSGGRHLFFCSAVET